MRSLPTTLDGSQGFVVGPDGVVVAAFAIDDQRVRRDDPVYAVFEDGDPAWLASLDGPCERPIVALNWHSGRSLEDVVVGQKDPFDPGDPLGPGEYELVHPDL
jgi:hypothetical protein